MTENKEYKLISDFADDHFFHFGAYPIEVETSKQVYTFDQYWAILEAGEYDEKSR